MKTIFLHRFYTPLLVLGGMLVFGLVFSAQQGGASATISPDQCCRCHLEVCEEAASRPYVHPPVLENQCAVCHVKGNITPAAQAETDPDKGEVIDWFAKDCQEDDEHWFELPASVANSTVALMAKAGGRKILEQEVALPSLDQVESFPLVQGGPEIFDLRVVEVKKGVFLSARIAWRTDRITDAQILYGDGTLKATTAMDSRWSTRHELMVTGLERGKTYQVVAASQDIYGNKTMSLPLLLSTHEFYSAPALPGLGEGQQVDMRASYYQQGDRLFARFATSHPVAMRLGRYDEQGMEVMAEEGDANVPQEHLEMTDPHFLTITACVGCHPQSKGKLSHPVDVRPKSGMYIPPEYHTMADGRLTCMSCHQAHASHNEYRLTRARRKDLCLGCHRNFG